jgi:ubiquinone/menaquinone biosynthesis C-methylase UbiE
MLVSLTPSRRRGIEVLDAHDVDPGLRRRSHRDIQLANMLFGGTHALMAELREALPDLPRSATLLDVGTGVGDIPARAALMAARRGVTLLSVGLDSVEELVSTSTHRIPLGVCANALELPFAAHSIDVVCCSQLLHHFEEGDALRLVREMHRVARVRVIISDLRRNWLAVAGLWGASFPLRFHPVSRHDGVVSILRGFTTQELRRVVKTAIGVVPKVRHRALFRITAAWTPAIA